MTKVYYVQIRSTELKIKTFEGRADANQFICDFVTGCVLLITENGRTTYFRDGDL